MLTEESSTKPWEWGLRGDEHLITETKIRNHSQNCNHFLKGDCFVKAPRPREGTLAARRTVGRPTTLPHLFAFLVPEADGSPLSLTRSCAKHARW